MANACGHEPYTVSRDPAIEEHIHSIVTSLCRDVVASIRPMGVVLTGSGSRGEMTAYRHNGDIVMVSDIEMAVVDANLFKRGKIRRMGSELARKYGVDLTLMFFLPRRFREGVPANWAPRNSPLSIEQYETFAAGRFLYGPDLRAHPAGVEVSRIPVWEGIRLLFNRMAEFCRAVLTPAEDATSVRKACTKLSIAAGDAWLLRNGQYHYSYRERMERLATTRPCGSALRQMLVPAEHAAVVEAYRLKLYGERLAVAPTDEWLPRALAVSQKVFEAIIREELSLEASSCRGLHAQYLRHRKLRQYCQTSPLLANVISLVRTRGRPVPISLSHLLTGVPLAHKAYADVYLWLYGRFAPAWTAWGSACLTKDAELANHGRMQVRYWQLLCE
jgi:hypothetical protein